MECPHLQVCKEWHELCTTGIKVHDLEEFCKICYHKPMTSIEDLEALLDDMGVADVHR